MATSRVPGADARDARPVVVGVDGSDRSKEALAWGGRYAALAGTALTAIAAWHFPTGYGWTAPMPSDWDPEADTREMLERAVKEVLGSEPASAVELSVVQGPPARVLADASRDASLVVVGNRGRGEFAGMLLGSVSAFLATHAHCPVVIVRGGSEEDGTAQ